MTTKTKWILVILVHVIALLTACDDDAEQPQEKPLVPNGPALDAFIEDNIESHKQSFTLNSETGGDITGSEGTVIKFFSNSFKTLSGDAVTGTVDIELIEVYSRANMLLTDKPTTGKLDNGDHAMLISGGEFYVNATQNGNQLKLISGYNIIAPTGNTGGTQEGMKVFSGIEECIDDDCNNVWIEEKDRGMEIGQFQNTGGVYSAYFCFQNKFGWTNIDKWYSDPRPKTTIFVDAPEGFDNTNCAIFLSYDEEPTSLARFDTYDQETGLFSEHYGLIPIGLKVHFILVSIVDDEIHYAIQGAEITENHVELISEIKSITEEELIELIGNLP
jgi:hypothetical protein